MAKNKIRAGQQTETAKDFTILDGEDAVVGHIRIKPNAVAWCPKGKQKWHQVSLARFATIAAKKGDQKAK